MDQNYYASVLTERDRAVFELGGFGNKAGLGVSPAVLVIDVTYRFCGDREEPILESMRRWRTSCGVEAWDGIRHIQRLLKVAREIGVPIFYTRGWTPRSDLADSGRWAGKMSRIEEDLDPSLAVGNDIVAEIAPGPGDMVLEKGKPSAFFGTHLLSYLIDRGIDSLLVCGTTTSGCVRATVVDAFSYNYRVGVVKECSFDRGQMSHEISLFDMDQKYADVLPLADAVAYLKALSVSATSHGGREVAHEVGR